MNSDNFYTSEWEKSYSRRENYCFVASDETVKFVSRYIVKRIGINNGKRWTEPIKNGHWMSFGDCFQYYNSKILEFIQSRI